MLGRRWIQISFVRLRKTITVYTFPETSYKSCRVGCLFSPIHSPFLILTKVDWLKNELKDHETEVPCCENLQAANSSLRRVLPFPFFFLFHRSNPSPRPFHWLLWDGQYKCVYEIPDSHERDIWSKHVQASTVALKWSKIDFAPIRTHYTDCQCPLVMVFN